MKNLKELTRQSLKEIQGGAKHECDVDSDCSTVPGCGICRLFLGQRVCIMFSYDPDTDSCPG